MNIDTDEQMLQAIQALDAAIVKGDKTRFYDAQRRIKFLNANAAVLNRVEPPRCDPPGGAVVSPAVAVGTMAPRPPNGPDTRIGKTIALSGQLEMFAGYTLVSDIQRIVTPGGRALTKEQFDDLPQFSGREYVVAPQGAFEASAWEAFTQSKLHAFPKVRGMFFDPADCGQCRFV